MHTATLQSEKDYSATENTGVGDGSAGQPGEDKTGPDGGETHGLQRPRHNAGSGRKGAGGATTDRVTPLGSEVGGRNDEKRGSPQRGAGHQEGKMLKRQSRMGSVRLSSGGEEASGNPQ